MYNVEVLGVSTFRLGVGMDKFELKENGKLLLGYS